MSRNYKFHEQHKPYFVSFATVYWIDVFIREEYCQILVDSLDYCQKNKGLILNAWCIMSSHVHLIFRAAENKRPENILRDLKRHTAKAILKNISENPQESRKEWMLWMMERAGKQNSHNSKYQFWQQHNHPIELYSGPVIDQKLQYLHNNPVTIGWVDTPENYRYSSAKDYAGIKGLLDLELIY